MRADNILQTIGGTPHVRINRMFGDEHEVWIKSERSNPGGSIKDRIGIAMIEDAERRGAIDKDTVIIEPTSGNTGIGLALAAAVKGYKLILVMPESMTVERRRLMAAFGATFDLTPREKGMKGAIARAHELLKQYPNSWMPQQFENPANVEIHKRTTAQEILTDFPNGFDFMVTGVGTGGHISGVGEVLKERFPELTICAVEPAKSPVLSGGEPSPHRIQGVGAGFVPSILNRDVIDKVLQVTDDDAYAFAARAAREEGILVGPSSGASLAAVAQLLESAPEKSRVLTFCYDTGERYLSIEGLFPI
jgi:cysteine synthase A